MDFMLLTDLLICLLMGFVLWRSILLDKRLKHFESQREKLGQLGQNLQGTLTRAEAGLRALQEAAQTQGHTLQLAIEEGKRLQDDLGFILDHGQKLANQLTEDFTEIRRQRDNFPRGAMAQPMTSPTEPSRPGRLSSQDLLKALDGLR